MARRSKASPRRRPAKGKAKRPAKGKAKRPAKGKARPMSRWRRWALRILGAVLLLALGLPPLQVSCLKISRPLTTGTRIQRTAGAFADASLPRQQHDWVPLEEISPELVQAVLVSEDQRYWIHGGFDLDQVEKAVADGLDGKGLRGASTLSMQTSRTLFLWQGRSWTRKGFEAVYTLWLEQLLAKERILELYLNEVEWGPQIYGAQAAARHHFGTTAASLTREQACALASILPAPRTRDPNEPTASMQRKIQWILGQMDYPLPKGQPSEP